MTFDEQYQAVTADILGSGIPRPNRTGVSTLALPSAIVRHDLSKGFPLLTLKRVPFKMMAVELEGFIKGVTDKQWYQERGCTIWDEWCNPQKVAYKNDDATKARMKAERDLGPIYGSQWRSFNGRDDQLETILWSLYATPDSRRMVCSAWNPMMLPVMALPPCHVLWQVLVIGERLHLNWYQRSADWFLGVPFNMASYALLACLLSAHAGIKPGIVTGFFGDSHLYENQYDAAKEVLHRTPRACPTLVIPDRLNILEWTHKDARVDGYDPHPAIKVEVVV